MGLATRQRQELILTELLEKKHVTVKELALDMAVSEATVRRDLRVLAEDHQVTLIHGGATLPRGTDFSLDAKARRHSESKRLIGELAANLISDGDQVFLDSGSTCLEMATPLRRKQGVSVVLSSLRLAQELRDLRVILLGGRYRPERMDTVGPLAINTLEHLRGYTAFIGADGLCMDFGPSAVDIESAHLYCKAVENARQTVLLVDFSKFEAPSLFRIVEWSRVHSLVTDMLPAPEWREFLEERQIEVICP